MPLSPEQARAKAQRAARTRWHGDSPDSEAAREALDDATEQARVDAHIDAIVKSAPKMTEDQATRLRSLFVPLVKATRTDAEAD